MTEFASPSFDLYAMAATVPDGISMSALSFPFTDETLFHIGPLAVRWYALSYIVGILLGWLLLRRLTRAPDDPVGHPPLEHLINAGIIGIIVGGRLAYVLFYNFAYYASHPIEALYIWQGGMSFHGGMMGMIGAVFYVSRRHGTGFFRLMDLVAVAAPIGLFLGRIANFINCELYGRITEMPWGVMFNQGTCLASGGVAPAGDLPRHPSQIYEALLEGAVLFLVLILVLRLGGRSRQGLLSGLFLAGYGLSRILVEVFREPDSHIGTLTIGLTMGQLLSLPMIFLGVYLVIRSNRFRDQG